MRNRASYTRRLLRSLSGQGGFTLVSMFMSFTIGGVILTGAWMAITTMKAQEHVANCDRQMDQYAHACFQELTNLLSWSWAGVQIQGGTQHTQWKFLIKDVPQEYGTTFKYHTDGLGFLFVTFHPTRGLLINGSPPPWAQEHFRDQFIFVGSGGGTYKRVNQFDHRDRMSIEGMIMDYAGSRYINTASPEDVAKSRGTVMITMTLQYRYTGNSVFGLYSNEYVRERVYSTQIYMRNWDSNVNQFKKDWILSQIGGGA